MMRFCVKAATLGEEYEMVLVRTAKGNMKFVNLTTGYLMWNKFKNVKQALQYLDEVFGEENWEVK